MNRTTTFLLGGLAAVGGILYFTRSKKHTEPLDHNAVTVRTNPRHLVEQDLKKGNLKDVGEDFKEGAKNVVSQMKESGKNVVRGDSSVKEEAKEMKKTMKA
jgi:gas vesicle protein